MKMTPEETLQIERTCERLVLDAGYLTDHQDYAGYAALFAPEGTLSRPGGAPLVGPAAIQKSYESRPATRITRHLCTNILVTVESAERARALTYVLLFTGNSTEPAPDHFGRAADAKQLVGEFEDEFERTPQGWRIQSRQARFVLHT
jgi:SnoaL-like domain